MTLTRKPTWKHFSDLSYIDINVDLHLHTNWTDGEASIEAILGHGASADLRQIAFTEHVRMDTDWYQDFAAAVRAAAILQPDIEVFLGCEAKALDTLGGFDASEAILRQCDVVLGSVHRFPDGNGGFLSFSSLSQDQFAEIEFALACGLIDGAPIDVLAHPGGMYSRRFGIDLPAPLMRALMERSNARGIAIEVNSAYLKDIDAFLRLCADVNPIISIGSDMHRLNDLGQCRNALVSRGIATV
jgi:putative hydrolase